eukprot:365874-Chlamydomonas_euryale.AAC.3
MAHLACIHITKRAFEALGREKGWHTINTYMITTCSYQHALGRRHSKRDISQGVSRRAGQELRGGSRGGGHQGAHRSHPQQHLPHHHGAYPRAAGRRCSTAEVHADVGLREGGGCRMEYRHIVSVCRRPRGVPLPGYLNA